MCSCRAGFERDCREEFGQRALARGMTSLPGASTPGAGFIVIGAADSETDEKLLRVLREPWPVFARQSMLAHAWLPGLPAHDRVSAILATAAEMRQCVSEVWVETADAEATRPLMPLCRGLEYHLRTALAKGGLLRHDAALPRLHVFLATSTSAYLGHADPRHSSPWPMGIPRLRMPRAAPSRSVLKLEEALRVFLTEEERHRSLRPGMLAVDLGAAPGGWSWLLARHGMRVIAVDNGRLAEAVLATGQVEHRREDGFAFRPRRRVDWMVCDIVEQPSRVAQRVSRWFARSWCRQAIFNLKLPMKRRYEAVMQARAVIERAMSGRKFELQFRQLYHDREEVTGFYRDLQG
ncbi:MAG: Ribosomal RNA large subunit methyltransferase M [Gammaproteobacteria bacterium]|nr:Ribosomal RNA large subunit methyltransferase M [Gammaproteobacteria bacterium]